MYRNLFAPISLAMTSHCQILVCVCAVLMKNHKHDFILIRLHGARWYFFVSGMQIYP